MANNHSNIAVLIDGDNVTSKIIGGLMAEIAKYGTANVRRIYGDWTSPNLTGWKTFCIVSSDSDFTRLASRIREQGVTVYGFGERKTPSAFRNACNHFIFFDALDVETEEPPVSTVQQPKPVIPLEIIPAQPKIRHIDQTALVGLAKAINSVMGDSENWVNLADVGNHLSRISPDLQARNYGYQRLREFVAATGIVDMKKKDMGDNPPVVMIRLKGNLGL